MDIYIIVNVVPMGFKPMTSNLEGCCSIQLSYRTILVRVEGIEPPQTKNQNLAYYLYTIPQYPPKKTLKGEYRQALFIKVKCESIKVHHVLILLSVLSYNSWKKSPTFKEILHAIIHISNIIFLIIFISYLNYSCKDNINKLNYQMF